MYPNGLCLIFDGSMKQGDLIRIIDTALRLDEKAIGSCILNPRFKTPAPMWPLKGDGLNDVTGV